MGFYSDISVLPNRIESARQERLKQGLPLIDLTNANPTKHGYLYPTAKLEHAIRKYFDRRRYEPDAKGQLRARERISQFYAERSPAFDCPPEQIVITASTSEAYRFLFSLLADPGDNILLPEVGYPLFELIAQDARLSVRHYPVTAEKGCDLFFPAERGSDKKTKAVVIVSPHNPLGCFETELNVTLAALGLPIICDEVFCNFSWQGDSSPPLAAFYETVPVFLLNGISKMFALPDLKLGWVAMNRCAFETYGERLEILNDSYLSCNSLTQTILPEIFEYGNDFAEAMKESLRAKVQIAARLLKSIPSVNVLAPNAGIYLCPELSVSLDEDDIVHRLIENGVFVHPGYFYGFPENPGHPRFVISAMAEVEELEVALDTIGECVMSVKS